MTITATIVADSVSPQGHRLTTFQLRYPRFIHAEVMTHRVFSRNASSSRAIPVAKMIEDLRRDPAMPTFWGSNKPGMQAGEELTGTDFEDVRIQWLLGMNDAIFRAEILIKLGLHKQIANRVLEPWAHINVVVTATSFENFYALRRHPDAQPEIKVLADAMWQAQQESLPQLLHPGEWHLPFITEDDRREAYNGPSQSYSWETLKRISVARCARVSYLTHDGRQTTWDEDTALFDRLVGTMPLHASPAEHQATPDIIEREFVGGGYEWSHDYEHGNFTGWRQFRKMLPGEFTPG